MQGVIKKKNLFSHLAFITFNSSLYSFFNLFVCLFVCFLVVSGI